MWTFLRTELARQRCLRPFTAPQDPPTPDLSVHNSLKASAHWTETWPWLEEEEEEVLRFRPSQGRASNP